MKEYLKSLRKKRETSVCLSAGVGRKLSTLCLTIIFPEERNAEKKSMTSLIKFSAKSEGGGRADDAVAECRQLAAHGENLLIRHLRRRASKIDDDGGQVELERE